MNKTKSIIFIALFAVIDCSSQGIISEKNFYSLARSTFLENHNNDALEYLTEEENCFLEKTIEKDLGKFGKPGIVVFNDVIMVKTFVEPNLEMPFSFVYDSRTKTMYLIILPHLYKSMYDIAENYEERDEKYVLKRARELIKLDSELLSFLLLQLTKNDAFGGDFRSQVSYSKELFSNILPLLDCNYISSSQFLTKVTEERRTGDLSDSAYEEIQEKVFKNARGNTEWQFIFVEWLGHVLCKFEHGKNGIEFSMYLLPALEGTKIARARHTLEKCSRSK